jgi:hypothetical protein
MSDPYGSVPNIVGFSVPGGFDVDEETDYIRSFLKDTPEDNVTRNGSSQKKGEEIDSFSKAVVAGDLDTAKSIIETSFNKIIDKKMETDQKNEKGNEEEAEFENEEKDEPQSPVILKSTVKKDLLPSEDSEPEEGDAGDNKDDEMDEEKDSKTKKIENKIEKEKILFGESGTAAKKGKNADEEALSESSDLSEDDDNLISNEVKVSKRTRKNVSSDENEEGLDEYEDDGFIVADDTKDLDDLNAHRKLLAAQTLEEEQEEEEYVQKIVGSTKTNGSSTKKRKELNWEKILQKDSKIMKILKLLKAVSDEKEKNGKDNTLQISDNHKQIWDWIIKGIGSEVQKHDLPNEAVSLLSLNKEKLCNCLHLILISTLKSFNNGDLNAIKDETDKMEETEIDTIKKLLRETINETQKFYKDINIIIDDFIASILKKLNDEKNIDDEPNCGYLWLAILKRAKYCVDYTFVEVKIEAEQDGLYTCWFTNRKLRKGDSAYALLVVTKATKVEENTYFYIYKPKKEENAYQEVYLHAVCIFLNLGSFRNSVYIEAEVYRKTTAATEAASNIFYSYFEEGKMFGLLCRYTFLTVAIRYFKKIAIGDKKEETPKPKAKATSK